MPYDQTIDYYDTNAGIFCAGTKDLTFTAVQDRFLSLIKRKGRILDLGCGSGRDTFYFLRQGFRVDAVDGSIEICKRASEFTGIPVRQMLMQDLTDENTYDGIWACASLLHLTSKDIRQLMPKIAAALKPAGILYASFKYGETEGYRGGRYFTDMTERKLHNILNETKTLDLKDTWITSDIRKGREQEKWLNILLRRNSQNRT